MKIEKLVNNSINFVERSGHWIQDRSKFMTMERNERVSEFEKKTLHYLKKVFKNSYNIRTYPDKIEKLYTSFSKWLRIKRDQILITDGADGGLLRFFSTFATKGCKVLYYDPSYAMYPVYCRIFKCKPIPFKVKPDENYEIFIERLFKTIKKRKPKLITIANPNQPIEVIIKDKDIIRLCKLAKKNNSLLVVDEAYFHFNKISAIGLIKKFKNLVVVRTFSKAFGLAGLRIGYVVASNDIIRYLRILKPIYEINNINLEISEYFLKNLKIMRNYVQQVASSRTLFKLKMKQLHYAVYGKYSNTMLLDLKNKKNLDRIFKYLFNKKILTKKTIFEGKYYLRCTVGDLNSTKRLIKEIYKCH